MWKYETRVEIEIFFKEGHQSFSKEMMSLMTVLLVVISNPMDCRQCRTMCLAHIAMVNYLRDVSRIRQVKIWKQLRNIKVSYVPYKQEGNALIDLWRHVVFLSGKEIYWSHLVTLVTSGHSYSHLSHLVTSGHTWSHQSHLVTSGHTQSQVVILVTSAIG